MRVQRAHLGAIPELLAELGRQHERVITASVGHPDHGTQGGRAARGTRDPRPADCPVQGAVPLPWGRAHRLAQVRIAHIPLVHRPRVKHIDRPDDASREPVICAEGDLQVLRKAQARIEEAELRYRSSAVRTRCRLSEGIKQRHRAAVAAQEQLLGAIVPVGVPDPDIRWGTAV